MIFPNPLTDERHKGQELKCHNDHMRDFFEGVNTSNVSCMLALHLNMCCMLAPFLFLHLILKLISLNISRFQKNTVYCQILHLPISKLVKCNCKNVFL